MCQDRSRHIIRLIKAIASVRLQSMMMLVAEGRRFYDDVDFLKAVGILLVVWCHLHDRTSGPYAWTAIRDFVAPVTMPIFFLLSGYFFHESNKISLPYMTHIKQIIPNYTIPFASFTVITGLYKLCIQNVLGASYVKYRFSLDALIPHLLNPQGGFATYLWFLYTLLLIQLLYPLLIRIVKYDLLLLLLFMTLNVLEFPRIFCLNLFVAHMPYFLTGVLLSILHFRNFISDKPSLLFGLTLLLVYFLIRPVIEGLFFSHILMYTALPIFLWMVSFILVRIHFFPGITYIGRKSIDIYLWHTLMIGLVKVVLVKTVNPSFWVMTSACFILASLGCVMLASIIDTMPHIKYILYGRY